MTNARILGHNVRCELENKGINKYEFAKKFSLSKTDIYKFFDGRILLPPKLLKEIMSELDIDYIEIRKEKPGYNYNHEVMDIIDNYCDLVEILESEVKS